MIFTVFSGFALALFAPWIHRLNRRAAGWILALLPLGIFVFLAAKIAAVSSGESFSSSFAWVPFVGLRLSFHLDGLSLLFALLISGIGALILVYAGDYMKGHPDLGRFFSYLLFFMASMLGVALSDNLLALFVFWELTSLSSYLLIGFDHGRERAREAALQALLVTGLGGLAMLAGFILLGAVGGGFEIQALLSQGETIRGNPLYLGVLLLVLAGAFTKSAQFPFHFWLPGAMEAPTPVSAYLHSATMVKAGVYLLARLSPALGGTEAWVGIVSGVGAATFLVGAFIALQQTDLKKMLAYSTVSSLGLLTWMLGWGSELALQASMAFLLAHALYKGALFMAAGNVDHETGTRFVTGLGGLFRKMPVSGTATLLAAVSMAGLIPFFGFVAKELFYEAAQASSWPVGMALGFAVAGSVGGVAVALMVAVEPFFGRKAETPKTAHEAPLGMLLGLSALAALSLVFGIFPAWPEGLLRAAVSSVAGEPRALHLALWHGFTPTLAWSLATFFLGLMLYLARKPLRRVFAAASPLLSYGPARAYEAALRGLKWGAAFQTRILQNGYLRIYLLVFFVSIIALVAWPLFFQWDYKIRFLNSGLRFYEVVWAVLIALGALIAAVTNSRMFGVVALGVVGYGIAFIYLLFGAPDLAMTQILVETLMLIVLLLGLFHMPGLSKYSKPRTRIRDAAVALGSGAVITVLVLAAQQRPHPPELVNYFSENSVPLGQGRNIVNVILVDFRALDTMGEITVLGLAALGVFALLKLKARGEEKP